MLLKFGDELAKLGQERWNDARRKEERRSGL
jgi:hypothetical protein